MGEMERDLALASWRAFNDFLIETLEDTELKDWAYELRTVAKRCAAKIAARANEPMDGEEPLPFYGN